MKRQRQRKTKTTLRVDFRDAFPVTQSLVNPNALNPCFFPLLFYSFRTSTAESPSYAPAGADSPPSPAPSLSPYPRSPQHHRPWSRTHNSRDRARSGRAPRSSCRRGSRGPTALPACGGIGGGRTSRRWRGR